MCDAKAHVRFIPNGDESGRLSFGLAKERNGKCAASVARLTPIIV
jgi:hypothetical protein